MEKETITEINELKKFLESIPAGDVNEFVNLCVAKCKTTRVIFRNWRLNITRVPMLEREIMNTLSTEKYNRKIFYEESN